MLRQLTFHILMLQCWTSFQSPNDTDAPLHLCWRKISGLVIIDRTGFPYQLIDFDAGSARPNLDLMLAPMCAVE